MLFFLGCLRAVAGRHKYVHKKLSFGTASAGHTSSFKIARGLVRSIHLLRINTLLQSSADISWHAIKRNHFTLFSSSFRHFILPSGLPYERYIPEVASDAKPNGARVFATVGSLSSSFSYDHVLSDSLGSNTFAAKYLSSWLDERSDAVSAFTEPGQHTNPALPKIMANRNESD